jgi:hypothetical protein
MSGYPSPARALIHRSVDGCRVREAEKEDRRELPMARATGSGREGSWEVQE